MPSSPTNTRGVTPKPAAKSTIMDKLFRPAPYPIKSEFRPTFGDSFNFANITPPPQPSSSQQQQQQRTNMPLPPHWTRANPPPNTMEYQSLFLGFVNEKAPLHLQHLPDTEPKLFKYYPNFFRSLAKDDVQQRATIKACLQSARPPPEGWVAPKDKKAYDETLGANQETGLREPRVGDPGIPDRTILGHVLAYRAAKNAWDANMAWNMETGIVVAKPYRGDWSTYERYHSEDSSDAESDAAFGQDRESSLSLSPSPSLPSSPPPPPTTVKRIVIVKRPRRVESSSSAASDDDSDSESIETEDTDSIESEETPSPMGKKRSFAKYSSDGSTSDNDEDGVTDYSSDASSPRSPSPCLLPPTTVKRIRLVKSPQRDASSSPASSDDNSDSASIKSKDISDKDVDQFTEYDTDARSPRSRVRPEDIPIPSIEPADFDPGDRKNWLSFVSRFKIRKPTPAGKKRDFHEYSDDSEYDESDTDHAGYAADGDSSDEENGSDDEDKENVPVVKQTAAKKNATFKKLRYTHKSSAPASRASTYTTIIEAPAADIPRPWMTIRVVEMPAEIKSEDPEEAPTAEPTPAERTPAPAKAATATKKTAATKKAPVAKKTPAKDTRPRILLRAVEMPPEIKNEDPEEAPTAEPTPAERTPAPRPRIRTRVVEMPADEIKSDDPERIIIRAVEMPAEIKSEDPDWVTTAESTPAERTPAPAKAPIAKAKTTATATKKAPAAKKAPATKKAPAAKKPPANRAARYNPKTPLDRKTYKSHGAGAGTGNGVQKKKQQPKKKTAAKKASTTDEASDDNDAENIPTRRRVTRAMAAAARRGEIDSSYLNGLEDRLSMNRI